jgi:hypothetical protein
MQTVAERRSLTVLDVPLERDIFLRTLIRELAGSRAGAGIPAVVRA